MTTIILIAIAAGCASALMFASIVSGELVSLLLLYLAPLPLMVASMAWGPLSGVIGGITAAAGLGAIFGFPYSITFVIMVALPAWWLGHLALLGRPITSGAPSDHGGAIAPPAFEWYPVGRILLWLTGFAALTTMLALLTIGTDATTITGTMHQALLRMFGLIDAPAGESEQLIDVLVTMAPIAAAIFTMSMLTLNLWLAAKIAATSGRLRRPWPDLKSTALPPMTLAALSVAVAFCFSSGLFAILAQIVTAALMMAYALIGFAVLHTLTLAFKNRVFWLSFAYAVVVMFSWLVLTVAALGLADAVFGLRQRYLRSRPPPLPAA
ncbi:DUF2232 domain-containing protein [Bradyrhizobium sp. dw_78]|uniref:DUF2232 domain-containing protein n=1 Tax=Bradyrhizobium sp. dw_78 TaxID=2719793 RepID=UPI001BD31B7D|nr:DUF2232 domain-containing protein [Bradyrhizobium sp. dw_78]